ncbi:hypothetical protein [Blattabacterium cuenoti]|uniref:hypothetical protein n=1 Tax=Blattabacterium cuenoti TaxID=1653831 RepID=UPI00163C3680|nr:hypothetical protein [Blattabacterium cuenoti]
MNFFKRLTFFFSGFIIGCFIVSYHNTISNRLPHNIKMKKLISEIKYSKKNYIFFDPILIKSKILTGKIFFKKNLSKTKQYPILYFIEVKEKDKKIIFIVEERIDVFSVKNFFFMKTKRK